MSFPTRTPLYGLHVHFRSVWVNAYNFRMYIQLSNMQPFEGNMYFIVWVFYMYLFFQIITHHYIFIFRSTRHPTNPPHNIYPTIYIYIYLLNTHIHTHTWFTKCCAWFHQNKNPSFHVANCCWFISGRFIHLSLLSWVRTFHHFIESELGFLCFIRKSCM